MNTWAGPYAGIFLGYAFASPTVTSALGTSINTKGVEGGAFAGYNGQSGSFVYGVEGDVGYNARKGTSGGITSKGGVDGSLRARLGYAVGPALLYVTGGGAAEQHHISDASGSDAHALVGWTAGAGVDAMLTDKLFGRVEYRYTDYGSATFNTGSGAQNVSANTNKISVGMGVKF